MTGGPLDHSQVVVEQKRKLFELRNQYKLFSTEGTQIGAVEQATQSWVTWLARLFSDLDVWLPAELHVTDAAGQTGLIVHKRWFTWTVEVSRGDGSKVGSVAKKFRLGKAKFVMTDASGMQLGEVNAENWRAKDFSITDASGMEVARVTKKWRGLLTEAFTDADTYVIDLGSAVEPYRSMALGASLAIDLIMKQKDSG